MAANGESAQSIGYVMPFVIGNHLSSTSTIL